MTPVNPLAQVNQGAIKGEPGTGFEKAGDLGEFECGNCRYFDGTSCGQPDMMQNSQQPKLPTGRVQVDEEDCCEFVDRAGNQEPEEQNEQGELPHPVTQLRKPFTPRFE